VVAALITYTWVTGFVGTTTTKAGNALQIQSVSFDTSNKNLTIYAQNVGQGPIKIVGVYINNTMVSTANIGSSDLDGDGNLGDTFAQTILPKGKTATIAIKDASSYITDWSTGQDVKIRIVCEDGTFTEGTFLIP